MRERGGAIERRLDAVSFLVSDAGCARACATAAWRTDIARAVHGSRSDVAGRATLVRYATVCRCGPMRRLDEEGRSRRWAAPRTGPRRTGTWRRRMPSSRRLCGQLWLTNTLPEARRWVTYPARLSRALDAARQLKDDSRQVNRDFGGAIHRTERRKNAQDPA